MESILTVRKKRNWLGRLLLGYWKILSGGYSIKGNVITFDYPPKNTIQITINSNL